MREPQVKPTWTDDRWARRLGRGHVVLRLEVERPVAAVPVRWPLLGGGWLAGAVGFNGAAADVPDEKLRLRLRMPRGRGGPR